jgi:hypothetical protein
MSGIDCKTANGVIRCPNCGGKQVHRSRRRGLLDSVMKAFDRVAYRCSWCRTRFYRPAVLIPASARPCDVAEPVCGSGRVIGV